MENKVNKKALYLAILTVLVQNNQTSGSFFGDLWNVVTNPVDVVKTVGKTVGKHVAGVLRPSSARNDDVVVPAHELNSCWLNSGFGAFSNCVDPILDDIYEKINDDLEKSEGETCDEESTKRLKETGLLASVIQEMLDMKKERIKTLSTETKNALGYAGAQGSPWQVTRKLSKQLEHYGYKFEGCEWWGDGLTEELDNALKEKYRITFYIGDQPELPLFGKKIPLSVFNHIYCLHVVPTSRGTKYYLANDKGFGFNYSAQLEELNETEARNLIESKGAGYDRLIKHELKKTPKIKN